MPRYDLPVGRVLTYRKTGTMMGADRTPDLLARRELRLTVLAANPDGSRRVVVRAAVTYSVAEQGKLVERPEEVSIGLFDVFPDGRSAPVGQPEYYVRVAELLPPLPPDAAALAKGGTWTAPEEWDWAATTFATAAPPQKPDEFSFTGTKASARGGDRAEMVFTQAVTVDRRKGVVVRSQSHLASPGNRPQTGRGETRLEKDERLHPAAVAVLAKSYDQMVAAGAAYWAAMKGAIDDPARAAERYAAARAVLAAAAEKVDEAEVAEELQRQIKVHDDNVGHWVEEARRSAAVLNQPAPAWAGKDLDGKAWAQADLKGKVVVLDFWSRQSDWAPTDKLAVNRLAIDYRGKPVVVLGMNADRLADDVRAPVKALGLVYPQVRTEDTLAQRFAIELLPALVVIDRDGVVRRIYQGHRPDLREKVAERVDVLLK